MELGDERARELRGQGWKGSPVESLEILEEAVITDLVKRVSTLYFKPLTEGRFLGTSSVMKI